MSKINISFIKVLKSQLIKTLSVHVQYTMSVTDLIYERNIYDKWVKKSTINGSSDIEWFSDQESAKWQNISYIFNNFKHHLCIICFNLVFK